ncbi:MAG: cytochrome b/b6 domain-containing protein [Anaerolineales bacterium]|nr:cytochrome b/b6 domain-containing protein [Anaerolineales bacterium]
MKTNSRIFRHLLYCGLTMLFLASAGFVTHSIVQAKQPVISQTQLSTIHPTFPFLDDVGENVLHTGKPVSTMNTCGACHNTTFIEEHSFHVNLGFGEITNPGETPSGRAWDTSPGFFGKWNSIAYRYLSPVGDDVVDLTLATWIQTLGVRHVGGGPAVYAQNGQRLIELGADPANLEVNVVNPDTGELIPWDWAESGVVEMNCFLCHTPNPDNQARANALHNGYFGWANTATLLGTGIVEGSENSYQWNPDAFTPEGNLASEFIQIQDPTNENCGLCHGLVHDDVEDPLIMVGCTPERWSTITTGQIVSPQKLSDSGMNLTNKDELNRSWDVHAERLLKCTDCHYSLNNPLYYQESPSTRPEHLIFDPRRLEIGEYLEQPLHQFARGNSAQSTVAGELKDTMRRCDSCHSVENSHDWLPYKDRHIDTLSCESCHIPQMFSSANMVQDWTVISLEGSSITQCRGIEGDSDSVGSLISGYEPVLLPRQNLAGETTLTPHNLITSWFWVYGDPPRPVRQTDLQVAYLENGAYHPGIVLRFDENRNGNLETSELIIDTPEKEQFVKDRLSHLGLGNPRIVGEVQPYSINHDVATGEWATKECQACHSEKSRITQPIQISAYAPAGVIPEFVADSNIAVSGDFINMEDSSLYYQPQTDPQKLYILGHDSVAWIDLAGTIIFVGVLAGIAVHGGLRFYTALRTPHSAPRTPHSAPRTPHSAYRTKKVYMYSVYERLWHWLQTFAIVMLLFTGLVIHKPDTFGIFSFRGVVLVHNVLAAILAINAFLSLFYHLASGEIQQYIPRPRGFFDQTFTQARFYLQGMFKGEEHPFEKSAHKKLNPLQQITYFAILNVLLPLQGITGILIWGVQRWPESANRLGGLPFLSPFHTLIAWLFAAFIVMHVYLTTTGHTPMASIKAMIMGWDELEVPQSAEEQVTGKA